MFADVEVLVNFVMLFLLTIKNLKKHRIEYNPEKIYPIKKYNIKIFSQIYTMAEELNTNYAQVWNSNDEFSKY